MTGEVAELGSRGLRAQQFEMRQISHNTLAIHKIGVIPFFRVQPHNLDIIIAEFVKLVQIIHLCQDEVKVDEHFVVPGINS
jgi:hypothetical protein